MPCDILVSTCVPAMRLLRHIITTYPLTHLSGYNFRCTCLSAYSFSTTCTRGICFTYIHRLSTTIYTFDTHHPPHPSSLSIARHTSLVLSSDQSAPQEFINFQYPAQHLRLSIIQHVAICTYTMCLDPPRRDREDAPSTNFFRISAGNLRTRRFGVTLIQCND